LTVWDAPAFVILCLADELRRHAGSFLHLGKVQVQLEAMETAFPALTAAARDLVPPGQFTGAIRELVADQVSIRDLWLVLDRIVDLNATSLGIDGYASLDDPVTSARDRATIPDDAL